MKLLFRMFLMMRWSRLRVVRRGGCHSGWLFLCLTLSRGGHFAGHKTFNCWIAIADSKSKKQSVKIVKPHQQKRKQPKKKFVPLQITLNPNHEAANKLADAVIVNLSNRSIRTHSKKREAEKWNRINAEHKQCAARGTRITNILHEDSD